MGDRKTQFWTASAIILLTALAPAMGGSIELWAQSILAIGAGLLLILSPPRRSLGLAFNLGVAALFLVALTAFLPAGWFPRPDWWSELLKLGAHLSETRSPQPWLTLQWTCFLMLVLAWSYLLLGFQWTRRQRENACIGFGIAILILSAALTTAFVSKLRIPFWPEAPEFGFFPNRNQTSNVLGLGGVMIYAIGLQQFQEGRKYWWLWFASLSLVCWALILNYSRAGIILFFFGALAVHVYWWSRSPDRRQPLVAFGGLLLLIALFIVDGGATLMRFARETAGFFDVGQNLRLAIYRDAINLIAKSSPLGVGLGNFWPIFSVNRNFSSNVKRVVHPESDWLWSAVDVGWIGLLIGLFLFFWWLKRCPPFDARTNRLLRVAAMICGIAFAIHGVFDVSGHRLGALWPALFFGSIAIHPENGNRRSKAAPLIARAAGALLIVIGAWWMASVWGAKTLPTTAIVERLRANVDHAVEVEDFDRAAVLASEALAITPLDWEFYFKRGVAEAGSFQTAWAQRDFALARYLLSSWPELYLQESQVWLAIGQPELGFGTLAEGMEKLPESAPALYSDIFDTIKSNAAWRDDWRKLGENDRRCLLFFLRAADSTEFEIELQQLLADDPQLHAFTDQDLKVLFQLWYEKGDKLWLAQTLQEHPEWKKLAWRQLAWTYAGYQDYRQAFETASAFLPRFDDAGKAPGPGLDAEALSRFSSNPTDPNAGLALALAQESAGAIDNALSTVLAVRALPDAPKNLPVLEARLWAEKKEWQKAWMAIGRLVPMP